MKPPALEKGCTKYGAQMGRRNRTDQYESEPLRLYRLQWVDGDYDEGGAYWGNSGGTSIYRAVDKTGATEIFARASNREEAKELVREELPNAIFLRN